MQRVNELEPTVTKGKMSSGRGTLVPNWLLIVLLALLVFFMVLSMGLMINRIEKTHAGKEATEMNSNMGEAVALLDRGDRTRLGGSHPVYSASRARTWYAESETFATLEGGENGDHAL